ncbi:MAG: hypothetical protein ABI577_06060 [bacterium]
MKILRLTNSSDFHPGVPEELRSQSVAARYIEKATGETVETFQRHMWPTEKFPDVIDRWIDEYEPDVILFRLSSFWVAYESVPLRVGNRMGRYGKRVRQAGLKVGNHPMLVERKPFKMARQLAARTIGGDTYFTPEAAAAVLEETFRRIVARESIMPVVRGTGLILNSSGSRSGLKRSKARVVELNRLTIAACERFRIPFSPEEAAESVSGGRIGDDLHDSAESHAEIGEAEGKLIADAWVAGRVSV